MCHVKMKAKREIYELAIFGAILRSSRTYADTIIYSMHGTGTGLQLLILYRIADI